MKLESVQTFTEWRRAARLLLQRQIPPEDVWWSETSDTAELFGTTTESVDSLGDTPPQKSFVTAEFLSIAQAVSCYRDPERWALLYQALWRLTHGEPHLLRVETDDGVRRLLGMKKAISHDIHKMHAFVRFRKVSEAPDVFAAWHQPAHYIVEEAAPFFKRRFGSMTWSILTPDRSAHWDGNALTFSAGVPRSQAPSADELEDLWRQYYRAIFNPARLKIRTMKANMAVRHWPTLPETDLIPELIRTSAARVQTMQASVPASAAAFIPAGADIEALRFAALTCQGCPLYQEATQTVFGEGPANAAIVLVGEAPGDEEDRVGHSFTGPAGQLLDRALKDAGLNRQMLYVTNAVKHFKFKPLGSRRFHKKPSGGEIHACRPWLQAELKVVKPRMVVCLGATAAQSVLGRAVRIGDERGRVQPSAAFGNIFVTNHPAAILRVPDPSQQHIEYQRFVDDLRSVRLTASTATLFNGDGS